MKKYSTSGYIYDDGDIPQCFSCGLDIEELAKEGNTLHDTPYHDMHCCDNSSCALELVRQGDEFEEVDEEE